MDRFKNILVTGGAGFIGSNFLNHMIIKYSDVNFINLDLLTYAGNLDYLNVVKDYPNYFFIEGDISDSKLVTSIFKKYSVDGVINFAAESHVDNSIGDPYDFIKTNINGTFNLLKVAYDSWMISPFKHKSGFLHSRFHQVSTDEVYGSIEQGSFNENSAYNPSSPYSSSKSSADLIVKSFNKTYGLNTTISLSSNNFGPNQNREKFIPVVLNSILNNVPVPVYGDGKNIRDWIFVDDNCKIIELIFKKGLSGESYNIGGGNEISNLDLIDLIFNSIITCSKNITDYQINFIDDRFGHDRRYSVNNSKIISDLGWPNDFSNFHKSLDFYVKNYINSHF